MADVLLVEMTETESYPIFACISDTGGAAGLFLGLNLIGTNSLKNKNVILDNSKFEKMITNF